MKTVYVQNMIRKDAEFDQGVELTQQEFFVGQKTAQRQILNGWKEIANYLGKGVRTVQRYERVVSLPVHRPTGKSSGGAVVAIPAELDNWVIVSDRRIDSLPMRQTLDAQTNRLRANFLQVDSEIALTFSDIAMHASDHEKRKRTAQTARKAYDAIVQLSEHTDLDDAEGNKLEANLRRLKHELRNLGQTF
jgi:hypothetical protein